MLSETVLEALVFSGCFDEFGEDRATILATIDAVLQYISLLGEDSKGMNLFAEDDEFLKKMKPRYRKTAPISIDEKLEKENYTLGNTFQRIQYRTIKINYKTLLLQDLQIFLPAKIIKWLLMYTKSNQLEQKKAKRCAF